MTKADIVARISDKLGIEKGDVQATVESFMEEVKTSLESGDNVYLRGFGSFIIIVFSAEFRVDQTDLLDHDFQVIEYGQGRADGCSRT